MQGLFLVVVRGSQRIFGEMHYVDCVDLKLYGIHGYPTLFVRWGWIVGEASYNIGFTNYLSSSDPSLGPQVGVEGFENDSFSSRSSSSPSSPPPCYKEWALSQLHPSHGQVQGKWGCTTLRSPLTFPFLLFLLPCRHWFLLRGEEEQCMSRVRV